MMDNGVMLTENALRCVAKDIELYYKKKAPNGAWCIATCRNAAAQFEKMRSELAELRRAQPENKPLTLDELRQIDGEPVWIVTLDGTDEPRWEIVVSAGKYGVDLICVLNGVETSDYADFDLYNDTWLAYRNKPIKEE